MRFDNFISALDMGQCQDQMQRQALFDIALLFVVVDGVVDDSEVAFMKHWLDTIPWSSPTTKDEYYANTLSKCQHATDNDGIEDFILHRANQLVDKEMRQQALKLAEDIAHADGEVDAKEKYALDFLISALS
jgi:tellurite resistance protein